MAEKIEQCRICNSSELKTVLDMGEIYPSNFVRKQDGYRKEPLVLVQCQKCSLVQLGYDIELDTMYKEHYWYRSSLNKSMLSDLEDIVKSIEERVDLQYDDVVIDIGCNDGSLFDFYSDRNLYMIGYDPAPNLASSALEHCDIFVNDYFPRTSDLGHVKPIPKKAKVITTIAMFYDLPDPNTFISGIKNRLADDGLWVIQFTDLYSMFKVSAFDNICHEHLEYYSLAVLLALLDQHNFMIEDCEYNKVNGGSLRVYVRHASYLEQERLPSDRFIQALKDESKYFLTHTFEEFHEKVLEQKKKTLEFLSQCKSEGKKVFLLGASTKGNTLLQFYGITKDLIPLAAEVNSDKFGLRTIGSDIEIVSQDLAIQLSPDYFFVPIWHFMDDILKRQWAKDYIKNGGRFIVPLPQFTVVEN